MELGLWLSGLSEWRLQLQLLLIPSTILYLLVVKRLRFHRSTTMPVLLGYPDNSGFSHMTVNDARQIHNSLIEFEFPITFSTATTFALFKAYGIPSISSLLCATGQFSSKLTVDKRYADTGCLLLEAVLNPPASSRALEALARINYLHSTHRASGKITDEDMLYTLSLFALEPSRWVAKFEWRELTRWERCAVGTLWKQLGEALGVNYDPLPGSRGNWRDGIEWLEELDLWSREYQDVHMVPATTNKKVADATLYHMVWSLPTSFKFMGKQLVAAIMGTRLREAMMIPEPPQGYFVFIRHFTAIRRFVLLHLALPRIKPKKRLPVATSSGRKHARKYNIRPWYVRPTILNRYGPVAWMTWLNGSVLPGSEGDKYFPGGFVASELGPYVRGGEEQELEAEMLKLEYQFTSEVCKNEVCRRVDNRRIVGILPLNRILVSNREK